MVSDADELRAVLSPLTKTDIRNLDRLNIVDFAFMLAYGFFLWFFMTLFGREVKSESVLKIRWVTIIVVIADIAENFQLLHLSDFLYNTDKRANTSIFLLEIFTWTKWLLLAFLFGSIGYDMLKMQWSSKIIGLVLILPCLLGGIGIITKIPQVEDQQ